ncbi:hypothetical protein G6F65_016536 [Rhizopus arrhizus]|nr:hypothetical protein G6F65_016536 [Rhizopus arrhizus]
MAVKLLKSVGLRSGAVPRFEGIRALPDCGGPQACAAHHVKRASSGRQPSRSGADGARNTTGLTDAIRRLALHQLRRFSAVDLLPQPGLNLLTGDNGAGKTSVLEALHLMAYGRSFRGRVRDGLVRQGQEALEIFVEWDEQRANHPPHRRKAGLRHSGQDWKGRLDGEDVAQLGNLCAALAVVTFEPGSHALVSGGGEPRRRFLDWGLFHVEPDFLALWRRYSRALKQRNALLKQGGPSRMLDTWDHELAEAGEPLTSRRQHYLERLQQRTVSLAATLAPQLGIQGLELSPGWLFPVATHCHVVRPS